MHVTGTYLVDDWHSHEEAAEGEQVGSYAECDVHQGIVGVWQARFGIMRQLHVNSKTLSETPLDVTVLLSRQ